ncbi:hypothetical protein FF011L_18120 [Roseimaritima multifibrata]|uniref:Type II secretion system protein G n=1 Tax=Roseimaritima multifibrata TaxID=1930274 RepID=A0A517ME53_9BACT|nr:prepilin-type N-terminal cleavage/methylation domain-containing protein [Roseimaritima multifibrata]QDS93057.1 hypothetical protein FF011L_18120 [Roseimaritima multifibrata]
MIHLITTTKPDGYSNALRPGFSLLEIILAIVISSMVAMMGLHYMRPTGAHSHDQACELTRQTVQFELGRYQGETGLLPRSDLRELNTATYFANGLPKCPAQGGAYQLKGAEVVCPLHD